MSIDYVKCSLERRDEYKIITTVESNGKCRYVRKKAVRKDGIDHIERMLNYSAVNDRYKSEFIHFLPCKKIKAGVIEYDYLIGESLSDRLEGLEKEKKWNEIYDLVRTLKDVIYNVEGIHPFCVENEIINVFGDCFDLEGIPSANMINMDMTTDNIIITEGDVWNIIDYEWVVPFDIPLKYVLFRTIFFQNTIAKLPQEILEEIKKICVLSETEWDRFYNMEICFQNHVSNFRLEEAYEAFGKKSVYLDTKLFADLVTEVIVYDQTSQIIYNKKTSLEEIDIEVDVQKQEEISVQLCEKGCIIKLLSNDEYRTGKIVKSASGLQINDDYYFVDKAIIAFDVKNIDNFKLQYKIMHKGDPFIERMIRLLKGEHELSLKVMQDQEWLDAYKKRVTELEHQLLSVGDDYNKLNDAHRNVSEQLKTKEEENEMLHKYYNELLERYERIQSYITKIKKGKVWEIIPMLKNNED